MFPDGKITGHREVYDWLARGRSAYKGQKARYQGQYYRLAFTQEVPGEGSAIQIFESCTQRKLFEIMPNNELIIHADVSQGAAKSRSLKWFGIVLHEDGIQTYVIITGDKPIKSRWEKGLAVNLTDRTFVNPLPPFVMNEVPELSKKWKREVTSFRRSLELKLKINPMLDIDLKSEICEPRYPDVMAKEIMECMLEKRHRKMISLWIDHILSGYERYLFFNNRPRSLWAVASPKDKAALIMKDLYSPYSKRVRLLYGALEAVEDTSSEL